MIHIVVPLVVIIVYIEQACWLLRHTASPKRHSDSARDRDLELYVDQQVLFEIAH
jgi:hypothetical protein